MTRALDTSFDWHEPGLSIGQVSARSGVAPSALRFYEGKGLITPHRVEGGQRRYQADVLCRVIMIRACQDAGLTLAEVKIALAPLVEGEVPDKDDWERLAESLRGEVRTRIERFERVLARLAPPESSGSR